MNTIVHINKENKLNDYMNHLYQHLDLFKSIDGVVGITLNGGLSRGYADHLSEIDITIFLNKRAYKIYQEGQLDLKVGICKIHKLIYDIKVVDYDTEKERAWSPIVELWDLSYAKILYDPDKLIEELHKDKLEPKPLFPHVETVMFSPWWHYRLAGDIWIYREDPIQGHMLLNEAAKDILKALYLANDDYVPHEKWIVHLVGNLKWLPFPKEGLLLMLFSTGDLSLDSLIKRQQDLDTIWNQINDYIISKHYDYLPVNLTQKNIYDKLVKVLEYDSLSLHEFKELFGVGCLNSDPLKAFITLRDDTVYIDHEKFYSLTMDSMYKWQFDVTHQVQLHKLKNSIER